MKAFLFLAAIVLGGCVTEPKPGPAHTYFVSGCAGEEVDSASYVDSTDTNKQQLTCGIDSVGVKK